MCIAYDETRLSYNYKDGIGQIKKLWHKELASRGIHFNSLQAIEYIYLKVGVKAYKGTRKSFKSYNRTMKLHRSIK